MSLYNMVFGQNPIADLLLGILGLTREDVGRFRDAFVSEGQIAIYTRNGGGNRECWHGDVSLNDGYLGNPSCGGVSRTVEVDEYTKSGLIQKTGRRIMQTEWTCPNPGASSCGCSGCVITYRLPAHPLYISDADDEFDCTYATIRFRIPEKWVDLLRDVDDGKFEPSARWAAALDDLRAGKPEVVARMKPFVDALAEAVRANPACNEGGERE
jgi:hypothetical protein